MSPGRAWAAERFGGLRRRAPGLQRDPPPARPLPAHPARSLAHPAGRTLHRQHVNPAGRSRARWLAARRSRPARGGTSPPRPGPGDGSGRWVPGAGERAGGEGGGEGEGGFWRPGCPGRAGERASGWGGERWPAGSLRGAARLGARRRPWRWAPSPPPGVRAAQEPVPPWREGQQCWVAELAPSTSESRWR